MPSLGELGRLTDAEYADLVDRVDRFHDAWIPDEPANPAAFLPPSSAPHRSHVLVEMLKTDMELRAKSGMPVRVEPYLTAFPADLPELPVTLLQEEYLVRHRFADRPTLEEYRSRFPQLYDALASWVKEKLGKSTNPSRGNTAGPSRTDAESSVSGTAAFSDTQLRAASPPPPPSPPSRTIEEPAPAPEPAAQKSTKRSKSKTKSRSRLVSNEGVPADVIPGELEYKLLRKLGHGTFGEVYEAIAPGGFRVAVKKILRSMDHPASKGELESLEAIKTMTHPFLLQTQAYWVFRDRLIIVMELADGSLMDMIKEHKALGRMGVPPDDLIIYFEQVAEAIDYLHSQNVSHRDIKPQNLLHLKGYAKLADFGLARMHEHTQTNVGTEMGTPLYMAPEAWNKKIHLHSDQYSLAATYISARLGRSLYSATAMHELAMLHINGTPDLSPLEEAEKCVLLRALAKSPEDRYSNCKSFVKALKQAVAPPPPPPKLAEISRPPRVSSLTIVLAAVLFLAVACLGYVLTRPTAVQYVAPPTQPEKHYVIPGWEPNEDAGFVTSSDGRKFYKELTRESGGEKLVAIAVPPSRPHDPRLFYMLRDKISNRVFQQIWEKAEKSETSSIAEFQRRFGNDAKFLLPGKWREGAPTQTGEKLGISGVQAEVPVVNLTMPEAALAATELGGKLPTDRQWRQAVSGLGGSLPKLLEKWKPKPGQSEPTEEELESLGVALGLKFGPWPVTRTTPDVSFHGIRQLISNGYEWTCINADGNVVDLETNPAVTPRVFVVGQSWDVPVVLTPDTIASGKNLWPWDSARTAIGFRVVFDPP